MKKRTTSKTSKALLMSAAAAMLLSPTAGAAVNLISNGDFESTAIASGTFQELPTGNAGLTDWTISGGFGVMKDHNRFGFSSDGSTYLALESNSFGPGAGIISQTIATTIGDNYSLSFEYSALSTAAVIDITYDVGGADQVLTFQNSSGQTWATETFDFIATSTSTTLTFEGTGGLGSIASASIDNVSIVFVPEPSSTALLGLGGLALLMRRKRSA